MAKEFSYFVIKPNNLGTTPMLMNNFGVNPDGIDFLSDDTTVANDYVICIPLLSQPIRMPYITADIANLSYSELLKITATPDLSGWGDMDTIRQAWYASEKVIPKKANEALDKIMEGLDKINLDK